jgi:acetylornithine/succinyldiaminopimelate/putrescine aminotransferase
MIGIELDRPGVDVVKTCRESGLLINCTADRVLRLLPPFVLTDAQSRRGLTLLKTALAGLK